MGSSIMAAPSSKHPSERAIALSRENPLWGCTEPSFNRVPIYPYSTRDYYAPENRYSVEGAAHLSHAHFSHGHLHPGTYTHAGYAGFAGQGPLAYGNGHYGHPVGPQGMYNVSSGDPAAYPHFAGAPWHHGAYGVAAGTYGPPTTK